MKVIALKGTSKGRVYERLQEVKVVVTIDADYGIFSYVNACRVTG